MEKHTKLINFIKALIIIILAVLIIAGLSKLLILKSEDGINQFDALYRQPENSIDVIFLGSSHVYCDIATGVLWENHGLATFDLGGAEAPAWVSYYQLKEALRTQKPKVVCFEVSVAAIFKRFLTQRDAWATDNTYGMKWNSNRIDQLRVNSEEEDFLKRLNPFNIMHGRYSELEENDFKNVRDSADYKGFDPREKIVETETPDVSHVTEVEPCTEKAEEYIRKIIELTREEGIPIILFVSPYDVKESDQKILNYIETIAQSEGVEYIDFNKRYDDFGMDFSKDMSDGSHLTYTGNYKFSDYFGRILKEKYDIPDHRGDERYASWDRDLRFQNNERKDLWIKKQDDAAEIMTKTDDGFIIAAIINDKATIFEDNRVVETAPANAAGDELFRLSYRSGDNIFLFTDWMEKEDHIVSLFVNDKEYMEYYGNILFIYDTVTDEFVRTIYF